MLPRTFAMLAFSICCFPNMVHAFQPQTTSVPTQNNDNTVRVVRIEDEGLPDFMWFHRGGVRLGYAEAIASLIGFIQGPPAPPLPDRDREDAGQTDENEFCTRELVADITHPNTPSEVHRVSSTCCGSVSSYGVELTKVQHTTIAESLLDTTGESPVTASATYQSSLDTYAKYKVSGPDDSLLDRKRYTMKVKFEFEIDGDFPDNLQTYPVSVFFLKVGLNRIKVVYDRGAVPNERIRIYRFLTHSTELDTNLPEGHPLLLDVITRPMGSYTFDAELVVHSGDTFIVDTDQTIKLVQEKGDLFEPDDPDQNNDGRETDEWDFFSEVTVEIFDLDPTD